MTHMLAPTVSRHELTGNELAWVSFLRLLSRGEDPAPSLAAVQALRATFDGENLAE